MIMNYNMEKLTIQHCARIFDSARGGTYVLPKGFKRKCDSMFPEEFLMKNGKKPAIWNSTFNKYMHDIEKAKRVMAGEKIDSYELNSI